MMSACSAACSRTCAATAPAAQGVVGMGQIDQASPLLDEGDAVEQRHPARYVLVDVQGDDIAVGGGDLHSGYHPGQGRVGLRQSQGLERPGHRVVIGHRDAAQPVRAGGAKQTRREPSTPSDEYAVWL